MAYGSVLADVVQSSTAGVAPQFNDGNGTQTGTLCRAWVNFNGSTAAIRASFNVGSITKNGTGDYTVNFTTALADTNYTIHVMSSRGSVNYDEGAGRQWATPAATTSCRIWGGTSTGSFQDYPTIDFTAFR
jgi:hypothetical protein